MNVTPVGELTPSTAGPALSTSRAISPAHASMDAWPIGIARSREMALVQLSIIGTTLTAATGLFDLCAVSLRV